MGAVLTKAHQGSCFLNTVDVCFLNRVLAAQIFPKYLLLRKRAITLFENTASLKEEGDRRYPS